METNTENSVEIATKSKKELSVKEKVSIIYATIFGVCIVIAAFCVGWGLANFRSGVEHSISATGSANLDFESDLVVWRGNFTAHAETSEGAYKKLQADANAIKQYLLDNGLKEEEFVFSSVNISHVSKEIYDENGNYRGYEYDGYDLNQSITVSSTNISAVEKVSTDISSLLSSGIQLTSWSPEYYCTTMDDLKLELIEKATENAKLRVDLMASKSGARVGKLLNSNLGVFQITARNTGASDYTYDGCLDTSSRWKTATITVKLTYDLK